MMHRWPLLWLFFVSGSVSAHLNQTQQPHIHSIAIAPGDSIADALQQLSEIYDTPIASAHSALQQPVEKAISGSYTLDDALLALLSQHNLSYRLTPAGVLIEQRQTHNSSTSADVSETAAAEVLEHIQISGYRNALTLSHQARMDAEQISEFMFANEMGKLPDGSIAEVVLRLPGASITRDGGDGRQVSIRGLDASHTKVRVNGVETLATSASIDARGAINNSRRFDLNLLPAELVSRIELHKSSAADIDAGIAGTLDLYTARPFDFSEQQRQIAFEWLGSELSSEHGFGINALFAQNSHQQSFGWLLSATYSERPTLEKAFSTIRWMQSDWGDLDQPGRLPQNFDPQAQQQLEAGEIFHSRYNRYDLYDREFSRSAINLAMQWRPWPEAVIGLDIMSGLSAVEMDEYHISSFGLAGTDLSGLNILDAQFEGNQMRYADLAGVDLRSEYNQQQHETRYHQYSLYLDSLLSASLQLQTKVSYQESDFDNPKHQKVYLWVPGQNFSYDYRQNDRISVNSYGLDINSPEPWSLFRISHNADEVTNRFHHLSSNLLFELNDAWQLSIGGQLEVFRNRSISWRERDNSDRGAPVDGLVRITPFNYAQGFGVDGLPSSWVVASPNAFDSIYAGESIKNTPSDDAGSLRERSSSLYLLGRFDLHLWGLPLRGNAGLRGEWVDKKTYANIQGSDAGTEFHARSDVQRWLPSVNAVFQLASGLQGRFAYSRTWTQPEIRELSPRIYLNAGAQQISGGNPNLQPITSDSVDLGLDWQRQERYASITWFYKAFDSVVIDSTDSMPFRDTGLAPSLIEGTGQSGDTIYTVSRPVNGEGTAVQGVELSLLASFPEQAVFSLKPGINLNYTYADSHYGYQLNERIVHKPLIGMSRHVGNIVLFADSANYGARLAASYRSRYLQNVPSANGNDEEGVHSSFYLDLTGYWQFNRYARIDLEATNLTDEIYDLYTDSSNRPYTYSISGREYRLKLTIQL